MLIKKIISTFNESNKYLFHILDNLLATHLGQTSGTFQDPSGRQVIFHWSNSRFISKNKPLVQL